MEVTNTNVCLREQVILIHNPQKGKQETTDTRVIKWNQCLRVRLEV